MARFNKNRYKKSWLFFQKNALKAELKIVFSNQRLKEALKKHNKGEIDKELLIKMLDEAREALVYSKKLDTEEEKEVILEFCSMVVYQGGTLNKLYKDSDFQDQKCLAPFACVGNKRYEMLDPLLKENKMDPVISDSKLNGHKMIKCECKPGNPCKASKAEMKKWQEIFPALKHANLNSGH